MFDNFITVGQRLHNYVCNLYDDVVVAGDVLVEDPLTRTTNLFIVLLY